MAEFLLHTVHFHQVNCCLTSVIHGRGEASEGQELIFIEHLLCPVQIPHNTGQQDMLLSPCGRWGR